MSYEGQHTADVLAEKALGFLDDAITGGRPFFLAIAPVSPHSNVDPSDVESKHGPKMTEPIPAERHKHLFQDVKVPRTENFNPDTVGWRPPEARRMKILTFVKPSGVNWISRLPKQNQSNVDYNDHFYRSRLRALQTVDELVDDVVARLTESALLDNTYIIYTSDNGYHIGQHRLQPGKECGFEEDIRVPLFIRGPGVPANRIENAVTTHVDLVPTLFEIAGIEQREDFDGTPVPLIEDSKSTRHEHVNVEFWGVALPEGEFNTLGKATDQSDADLDGVCREIYALHANYGWILGPDNPAVITNNTYKALRIIGDGYDLYYSVWCSNEHELYDLMVSSADSKFKIFHLSNCPLADRSIRTRQYIPQGPS